MANMQCIEPIVGDWYRSHGQLFEVVAIDDLDDIVEVQHADGDLEEIEMDDWFVRCRAGSLLQADAPEDPGLATEREDTGQFDGWTQTYDELKGLRADAIGDLDLFD